MPYERHLEGKTAIITGASSGIGKEISLKLGEEGCKLVICARSENKLKTLKDKLDNKMDVLVVPTDVRVEEQVKTMVQDAAKYFGDIDILINNAGVIRYGEIEHFSTEDYKTVMETNVDGTFYVTREALPYIKKRKGNIVFVGSFDSNHPRSLNPIYAASKWWVKGFAHSIEAVFGQEGVGVTLINPSEVRTGIPAEDGLSYKEKFKEGEVIEPEEIAEIVAFSLKRSASTTLSQIDIYRRNKLSDFF